MRRLPVLLLVAGAPFAALADVTADVGTMNTAQCTGTANAVRPNESMTVNLSWTVTLVNTTATPAFTGTKYKIFAGNQAFKTDVTDGSTPCTTTTGDASTFTVNEVANSGFDSTQNSVSAQAVNLKAIATAAGYGACDSAASGKTIYICVQWLNGSSSTPGAFATGGPLSTDFVAPSPPTAASTTPGDGKLHLSCTAGDGDTQYKALAQSTDVKDTHPHWTGQAASCGDLTISGLVNEVQYNVTVYGLDDANNPSETSGTITGATTTGTPIPTNDYWDQCKLDNCPEKGGCATGGLAAGLVGGLVAGFSLLALRRRKS